MQQRRARVGDTLDDYCPRDAEVTAHTVVAVDSDSDAVSVTRCQTCETEHPHPGTPGEAESASTERPGGGDGPAGGGDGSVRRPLIRATLTHPAGTPPIPREPPVFTMHEQQRGGQARGKSGSREFSGNGRGRDRDGFGKKGSRRGGQSRSFKDGRSAGGQPGSFKDGQSAGGQPGSNGRSGNQAPRPDGNQGGRSRTSSSRRSRGRSR